MSKTFRDDTPTVISLNGVVANGDRITAVYRCRVKLEDLGDTDHPDVKFCSNCKQKVFKVRDFDGFERAVASRGCVWGTDARSKEGGYFLGQPTLIPYESGGPLIWEE